MKDPNKDMKFAERLVRLRADLPLRGSKIVPIKDVAKEAGVNLGGYSLAENGVIPGEKVLNRIAKYFDVSVDFLLHRDKEPDIREDVAQAAKYVVDYMKVPGKTEAGDGISREPDPLKAEGLAIAQLIEILRSGDDILGRAILANLQAFQSTVKKDRILIKQAEIIKKQAERIEHLEAECEALKKEDQEIKEKNVDLERRMAQLESALEKIKEDQQSREVSRGGESRNAA